MNTAGWTLQGDATLFDSNGDADLFPNEIHLCQTASNTFGGVFFNGSMTMSNTCDYWIADFDFRMFDGAAYDGLAFIVTSQIPVTSSSGGLLGMPFGGFTGFSVCMDGFNNCGGPSPKVEIRYNTTDECVAQPEVVVPGLIQNGYQNCRIVYNNGNISVFLNGSGTPILTGNYTITNPVFMGFTAANGGASGSYSIKNANIYTILPQVDAGNDHSACAGSNVALGAVGLVDYTYAWSPTTGLSNATAANPTLNIVNNGLIADTTLYVLTSTIGSCNLNDTAQVISIPYPAAPIVSATDTTICEGQTTTLIVNPLGNEFITWFTSATGGASVGAGYVFTTPPLSATTTYYAEATNNATCASATRGAFTVLVNAAPVNAALTAPKICEGQDAIFNIAPNAGVSVNWYSVPIGGAPFFTGNSANIGPITNDTTVYVESVSAAGCVSLTRDSITISVDPTPTAPVVLPDTICAGLTANFTATPNANWIYSWYSTPTAVVPSATGNSYTTPVLFQNAIFFVEATTLIGCTGPRIPVSVIVNQRPDTATIVRDTICPGEQAFLSILSQNGVSYEWFTQPTGGTPIGFGPFFTTPNLNTSTTFYVQSSLNNCTANARGRGRVLVEQFPAGPVVSDQTICPGFPAVLTITSPSPSQAYFIWYNAAGDAIGTGRELILNDLTSSTLITAYSYSNYANCPTQTPNLVNVFISDEPTASFEWEPDTAEVNQVIQFESTSTNPTASPLTYYWDFGNTYYSTNPRPSYSYNAEGQYPVTMIVSNGNGCKDTITHTISVFDIREVFIPSGFSPNSDQHNDEFMVFGSMNLAEFHISVFDRWGKIVFESNNINETWNGKFKNGVENCPESVYTVVVHYTTAQNVKRQKVGTVTIIR